MEYSKPVQAEQYSVETSQLVTGHTLSTESCSQFYVYEGYQVTKLTLLSSQYHNNFTGEIIIRSTATVATILLAMLNTTLVVIFCISKKHFYIQRAGFNPFKNIYKVLKYSWKHKVPEHRSAFTYWEEDIPRRIDLGKNKYGGPFTNEEVEDTKTFLRILPLLLCLFGYHLAGHGYSAPIQLQRTSCPSLPVLLLIVINPQHMTALVTVVGIPLYRLAIIKVILKVKTVRMLTKMWLGLYLSLLQVVLYIIVVVNHDTSHWPQHNTNDKYSYQQLPSCKCLRDQLGYNLPLQLLFSLVWIRCWKLLQLNSVLSSTGTSGAVLWDDCWQCAVQQLLYWYVTANVSLN